MADTTNAAPVAVGSPIWIFDINRRIYSKIAGSGPIWREHWRELKITGETSRSWVTSCGQKIPKKGAGEFVAFSSEGIDQAEYVELNRYRISEVIRRTANYETLVAIAKLVGYAPLPPAPEVGR